MLRFLKRLFGSPANRTYCLRDYPFDEVIRLPKPISPPGGYGKYTLVRVIIDIWYRVKSGSIHIVDARMAKASYMRSLGVPQRNIFSERIGRAWYISKFPYPLLLREAVQDEVSRDSRLRRLLLAIWHRKNRPPEYYLLIDALNKHASPKRIETILDHGARGSPISFTYVKPGETPTERDVFVDGVYGMCIRATDRYDQRSKNFRLDRIRNVRETGRE